MKKVLYLGKEVGTLLGSAKLVASYIEYLDPLPANG